MDTTKLMKVVGYLVIGSFGFFNLVMIVATLINPESGQFGREVAGPNSIFASREFFIAYHVWGVIIPIVTIYSLAREIRMLFMISLLLLLILMFYPYFTSSPIERAKGNQGTGAKSEDSLKKGGNTVPIDTVPIDTVRFEPQ